MRPLLVFALLVTACAHRDVPPDPGGQAPVAADVLAASQPGDWREPDPDNTLYLELHSGRVVMELAPHFAPNHVENIKALVREGYFDGLAIIRVQDNYVVQWGDPAADESRQRKVRTARATLPPEFTTAITPELPFTPLPDGDSYAPEAGHSAGFAAARDPRAGQAWLTHCYGALGVARGNAVDSGGGTQLYVVIGHAPRHLDRNITLVGRVIDGIELLSALPRGTGPLGFYEKARQRVPIKSARIASGVPEKLRTRIELLRTDTATWNAWVEARRNRREEWYVQPAGRIELCNIPIPARLNRVRVD